MHIHTHMQTHMHIHIHIHTHMHLHTHKSTHLSIHIHTYAYTCAYTKTYTHVNVHIHMHTRMHTQNNTHADTHTHAYTCPCTYTHTCTHTHTRTHIHVHLNTYMYVCVACMCLCMHVCVLVHACACMYAFMCAHTVWLICVLLTSWWVCLSGGFRIYCLIGWLIVWLIGWLLYCDTRVTQIIVWDSCRMRPNVSALHCSGAGAPDRLETKMRIRQSAVRSLSPVLFCCALCFVARSVWKAMIWTVIVYPRTGQWCHTSVFRSRLGTLHLSCLQRWNCNPAGYEIRAGLTGHVFGQILRSLCPTMTNFQGAHTCGYGMCVFVLLRSLRSVCSNMTTSQGGTNTWFRCGCSCACAPLSLSLSLSSSFPVLLSLSINLVCGRNICVRVRLCVCLLSRLWFARSAYSFCNAANIPRQKKQSHAKIARTSTWCVTGSFAQPCLRSCVWVSEGDRASAPEQERVRSPRG